MDLIGDKMSGPFGGGGPFGGNPFLDPKSINSALVCCPVCKKSDFNAFTTQYGIIRRCNLCKNEWSGGTIVSPEVGRSDISGMVPPKGAPAPDDNLPLNEYTGAPFRDPSKNYGGDE